MSWAASSGSAFQITNGDQVAVPDCTNITRAKAHECLGLTGREYEFDFKTIGRVKVYDGAQVTTTQAMLGEVPIQDDCVEQVEHG